jgi:hypothetical protein
MTRPRPHEAIRTPTYSQQGPLTFKLTPGLDPDPPCAPRPNRYPSFFEVTIGFEQDRPITRRMLGVGLDGSRRI